jgi:hypothetical protein
MWYSLISLVFGLSKRHINQPVEFLATLVRNAIGDPDSEAAVGEGIHLVEDRATLQRFNKSHGSLTNLVIVRHAFAAAETVIRPSRELIPFALGGSARRSFSAPQINDTIIGAPPALSRAVHRRAARKTSPEDRLRRPSIGRTHTFPH